MKTARNVFVNSAVFGIVIAAGYWFSSYHRGGTILLALMAVALTFTAGYMSFAQRHAQLIGDRDVEPSAGAGEDLGIFTVASVWPLVAAGAVFLMLVGAITSPFIGAVGIGALLVALWRLGAESNRVA